MIAALGASELGLLAFVLAVAVLLAAAVVAYRGRLPEAGVIAVIGIILLLLAS